MQMMNRRALETLRLFLKFPSQANASTLILIPALYNVLQYEFSTGQALQPDTLQVAIWLYFRGESVRQLLLVHQDETPATALEPEGSWRAVCRIINDLS